MNTILIIGFIVIIGITGFLIYLAKYSLFTSVNITYKNVGPYLLVNEKHVVEYKNVGPIMDKIYYDLKDIHRIVTTRGFGLYYDNPQQVEKTKLRSIAGCIMDLNSMIDSITIQKKYCVKEFPVLPRCNG
jgi:hypothetical protein